MGIARRLAELVGQGFGFARRQEMFLALRQLVPLGLGEPGVVRQVALPQTVGADDARALPTPLWGQADFLAGQAQGAGRLEILQDGGYPRRTQAESLRQAAPV